ncbi:H-NS family nucleoid-associated regulatory protein [Paraburkholderia panacisoli]|uniref:H-NS family nucleoid-associated regulatory protein n=1 Tax=Paraburkholderia panacisoli TaxID=2603818 RepID=UPI00319E0086
MNPKTGETWSGHARPPAWIKDVKDRSKFLIASSAEGDRCGERRRCEQGEDCGQ